MLIKKKKVKKNKKNIKKSKYKSSLGLENIVIFHVFSTFNNTIITLTDTFGNTIFWSTTSSVGFKGCKKSTSYAAQMAAENVAKKALKEGFKHANIFIKGYGAGRDSSVRGIFNAGINILSISDVTSIPHNGCKFKKVRRC